LDLKQINQENGMHRSCSAHRMASKYAYRLRDFGFHCEVDENRAVLGYYASSCVNLYRRFGTT